jgi:transcriptional regulator with XRE-family HTH domain
MKTMFGKNLKIIMKQRDVTQSELSQMTGIGRPSISQYCSGKNEPHADKLKLIADALECDVDFFKADTSQLILPEALTTEDMKVREAARRLGKSQQFIRVSLQNGDAPFGFATKLTGNNYTYCIPRMRFENWLTGIGTEAKG